MQKALELVSSVDERLGKLFVEFEKEVGPLLDALPQSLGSAGSRNIYGEDQKRADVLSNDRFLEACRRSGVVSTIATEELERPARLAESGLSVVMDPLDGSSNLESNNLMGTIVGVYETLDFPLKPADQLAAFYFLYGPYSSCVFAAKHEVTEMVWIRGNEHTGFRLMRGSLKIANSGGVYGIGGARSKWSDKLHELSREFDAKGLKLRYGGSFVGDFNQVVHYGGIFAYPATADAKNGKLRALYEAGPIAYIAHAAGGLSSDGATNILAKEIESPEKRTPVFVGSAGLVKRVEEVLRRDSFIG
jgi:fructose-1,6-bisphosphatase I